MTDPLKLFPPTRAAAEAALAAFVPQAGAEYARLRNFDFGPDRPRSVSALSPWVKLRILDEITIARAVLDQHSEQAAEKFLTEVFWRTYWKGWMELRPGVWQAYARDVRQLQDAVQTQSGLRKRWEEACLGRTGIAPFDVWAQQLVETGYLHNHARMWFASIWIFTLELPWQLGADFFLRHLLDGDAAVNTLSWRWVAGIQTPGKTYLATAENIAKFTDGRFVGVRGLAPDAVPRAAEERPRATPLPLCPAEPLKGRYGLLLHGEDADAGWLLSQAPGPVAIAYADAIAAHSPWQMAPHVGAFRQKAARAAVAGPVDILTGGAAIAAWAQENRLDQIVAPYAPVGPVQEMLAQFGAQQDATPLTQIRRSLDSAAWPLATKGFFPFKKHIPDLIGRFVRSTEVA